MSNMKGAKSVFHFTTSQYWSRNGFKKTTILIAILLLLGAMALTFFTGRPKSKKTEEKISLEEIQKNQKTILVLNTTDLPNLFRMKRSRRQSLPTPKARTKTHPFTETGSSL